VCALVLLHVVFAREGFVAGWAMYVLLAGVLLAVARRVAGGGESVRAGVAHGVRARVLFFGGLGGGGRGGRGVAI